MSVARVVEISSTSEKSFEDAINQGVARATATLRGVTGAWIKEQQVSIEGDRITSYKVMNPMNKFEGLSLLTNHLGSFLKAAVLRREARDSCHASRVISTKPGERLSTCLGMRTVAISTKGEVAVMAENAIVSRKTLPDDISVKSRTAGDSESFPLSFSTAIDVVNREKLQTILATAGTGIAVSRDDSLAKVLLVSFLCLLCLLWIGVITSKTISVQFFPVCFSVFAAAFPDVFRIRRSPRSFLLNESLTVLLIPRAVGWTVGCFPHSQIILQDG